MERLEAVKDEINKKGSTSVATKDRNHGLAD